MLTWSKPRNQIGIKFRGQTALLLSLSYRLPFDLRADSLAGSACCVLKMTELGSNIPMSLILGIALSAESATRPYIYSRPGPVL